MDRYKFLLDGTEVFPINGNGLSISFERQNNFRYQLSEPIQLNRGDFDIIDAAAFDNKFTLIIQRIVGGSFTNWITTEFYKTNCRPTPSQRYIEVSPKVVDVYKLYDESKEKEFDLLQLSPSRNKINYVKQAMFQVYNWPSTYITNILRGVYWEQRIDIPEIDDRRVLSELHFEFKYPEGTKMFIPGEDVPLSPAVGGFYNYDSYENGTYNIVGIGQSFNHPIEPDQYTIFPLLDPQGYANILLIMDACTLDDFDDFNSTWNVDGLTCNFLGVYEKKEQFYTFWRVASETVVGSTGTITHISGATNTGNQTYVERWQRNRTLSFPRDNDDLLNFSRWAIYLGNPTPPIAVGYVYLASSGALTPIGELNQKSPIMYSDTSASQCRLIHFLFHTRILTDELEVLGEPTKKIVSVRDVIPQKFGYQRALPVEYYEFGITDENESTATIWGKMSDDAANYAGEYFSEITDFGDDTNYPVCKGDWTDASAWYDHTDPYILDRLEDGSSDRELAHAYLLSDVIKILLNEIDPTLVFDATVTHSEFLFSATNPVSSDPQPTLLITPKSNATTAEYDNPATKALIKMSDIEQMLWAAYKVKMYIDESKNVIFEHVSWFEKGGTYSTPVVGSDLTGIIEPKTGVNWADGQDTYSFDLESMPERIKGGWMDTQSEPFTGFDIEIRSDYVSKGNIQDNKVQMFSADVDFMQAEQGIISKEGFAIYGCFPENNDYRLPFLEVTAGGRKYDIQNGYLSFVYLHDKYHKHGLPATDITVNTVDTTATSVAKNKVQDIEVPSDIDFNPIELVTTDIGDGLVEKGTFNLSNEFLNLTLKHDTN